MGRILAKLLPKIVLSSFIHLLAYVAQTQIPKLILPVGYTTEPRSVAFSPDGTKVLTSGDTKVKLYDAQSGMVLIEIVVGTLIETACFSPDGQKILTTSLYNTAKIWNAHSGALLVDFKGETNVVNASFSADGKKVITSTDTISQIWDAERGVLIANIQGHNTESANAYFSPDGKKVVTVLMDSTAKIWNTSNGKVLFVLKGHEGKVITACFSPDGRKVVTASDDGTAKIWSACNGALIKNLYGSSYYYAFDARFSPDGKKIITTFSEGAGSDGSGTLLTEFWNANSGKFIYRMKGNVSMALFSPNNKMIVTIDGTYNIARIWNAENWHLIKRIDCTCGWFKNFCFSPDSKRFLVTAGGDLAQMWDIVSRKLLTNFQGHTNALSQPEFFPGGQTVMTGNRIWDINTGTMRARLKNGDIPCEIQDVSGLYSGPDLDICRTCDKVTELAVIKLIKQVGKPSYQLLSPDQKIFLTQTDVADSSVNIWGLEKDTLICKFKAPGGRILYIFFSPNGQRVLTSTDDNIVIWDAKKGLPLLFIKNYGNQDPQFSPNGEKIMSHLGDTAKIWDAETGKLLFTLNTSRSKWFYRTRFSTDSRKIITESSDTIGEIWDAQTGVQLASMKGHVDQITTVKISPDGKKIVTASWDHTAKIWDLQSGALLADLRGHVDHVEYAIFSPDGKYIVSVSDDNTGKFWDVGSGKLLYTFFVIDNDDYFIQLPSGYYKCTPNAAKLLHYVTNDLRVITFEQLDVKFNRPDLVLQGMQSSDTSLILSYKKAWQKRVARLGFDTTLFSSGLHVPQAEILNRDSISFDQKTNTLFLHIKASDDSTFLDRFNTWINEVPLFGVKGFSLKNRSTKHFDTTISITLSSGNNRLESSVTNTGGLESYRVPLDVKYTPFHPTTKKLYFIGIGIDHFQDSRYNLRWSVKDIRNLAYNFKKKYGQNCVIDTLFDSDVTVQNIKVLKQRLQLTTENDKVIIAYSGHGLLSEDYDYFLSTYNVNFKEPGKGGLPYEDLEDLLDGIRARKKLMLIDACHSGEVDKEELSKMVAVQARLDNTQKGVIVLVDTANKRTGIKNSFDLMQQVFVNVGRSTGATVISAAAGTQFALERGDLKNGVFTYSILELMKKNTSVKISELKNYVDRRVTELTNGLQVPTSRSENKVDDWAVW